MSEKATTFEKVAASAPVNRQAAMQMGRGETFTARAQLHDFSEVMPEMRGIPAGTMTSPGFVDLTGKAYGRLVVVGLAKKRAKDGARWVARCKCGNYVTRSSKAIREGKGDRCGPCSYTRSLRDEVLPGMKNFAGGVK